MHAFFPPFGVYPNNAIVGGSADIAVGAALFKHVNKRPGIVIANIGDASAGCGPTWEALCFATMDQFKELWDEAHRGGLPLIMNFVNNFYGMGGQPVGETMGFKILGTDGCGPLADQMHAERIDGYNPLAVVDAIDRKRSVSSAATGRCSGHSDLSLQRPFAVGRELVSRERRSRSLASGRSAFHVRGQHRRRGACAQADLDAMQARIDEIILDATARRSTWTSRRGPTRRMSAASWNRPCISSRSPPSSAMRRRPSTIARRTRPIWRRCVEILADVVAEDQRAGRSHPAAAASLEERRGPAADARCQ